MAEIKKTTTNESMSITNQIWEMANRLRGNMDASEYRNYILGFMFYRYLSERQEKWILQGEYLDDVDNLSQVNDAYKKLVDSPDDLADMLNLIADSQGYAIEPDYTWKSIVEKVNNQTIRPSDFSDMFDKFNNSLTMNGHATENFKNIFADMNINNSRLGTNTAQRAKALASIVTLIDQVKYKDDSGHDILGDIYEYLIAKFAGNSGKRAGEFYTPHEVSEVLAKLATIDLDKSITKPSVYDFACGSGSLLLTVQREIPKHKLFYWGQELNTTTYNLARMNLMMHDVDYHHMNVNNGDTLEQDWPDGLDENGVDHPRKFDIVVANPPYSQRWDNNQRKLKDARFKDYGALAPKTKADYAFLLHGLYHLDDNGTMAIVLPHGVLFRGSKEETIRKALIKKNQIDAIIGLPAGLFYSAGIPTIIMVLKKNKTNRDVLFIDASKDFEKGKNQNKLRPQDINKIVDTYKKRTDVKRYSHVATFDEIKENDYNLNIPRYVDTFVPEPEIDLGQVARDLEENRKKQRENNDEIINMLNNTKSSDPKVTSGVQAMIKFLSEED